MPLVVICGKPCSGKSVLARRLQEHFAALGRNTVLISEESLGLTKAEAFCNPLAEKHTRGKLKHEVELGLAQRDAVTICDSLNYIKGFRYELWCLARSMETTYCVVYCHCPQVVCTQRNTEGPAQWPEGLFADICARFEMPLGSTKWDKPLFHFSPEATEPPQGESKLLASPGNTLTSPTEQPTFKRATFTKKAKAAPDQAKAPPPVEICEPVPAIAPHPLDICEDFAVIESLEDLEPEENEVPVPAEEEAQLYITYQNEAWARAQRRRQAELTNPPLDAVSAHLLNGTPLKQNSATIRHVLSDTDLLAEVSTVCRDIIAAVLKAHGQPPGTAITVPHAHEKVVLPLKEQLCTHELLSSLQAHFMRVAQMHPPQSKETAAKMFVGYLNSAMEKS
eukprot:TRINITY_DN17081_c0_g1_i1.p1 TRINITY_DN17081_c0_g1~~TRINITY_DN17081_c0_g1_i1.p1  ORF type:complete len:401 (+),score=56.15 TRINITY_DN17081_c0_g1_i1:24-1205(+)